MQQGLRHALGLYVWAYSAKDGFSAFDFADQLDRLGDRTVITVSRDLYKVWVEVKSSTCPSWNIINTAALARAQVA